MMRVLWVFDCLSPTLQGVASHLTARSDISLEIMCRWGKKPPLDPASIPQTNLICRNKLDFEARKIIRQKVFSGNFDIVHAYTSRNLANVVGACRGICPLPKIIGYRGTINRLRLLDPANWITFWHPRVSNIICVCEATNQALQASGISAPKLSTVWEGFTADTLPRPERSALAEFGIPEDAFVVGVVANMRPVKGIDLLLRAAVELADLRDIYWLLIGQVNDSRITKLAADPRICDRVRLPGPRANGGCLSGLFDIYAAPSRMEGLSMSIMEAMAQEACPVVSDVGGCPELVRDQLDGLVVRPEDSHSLAQAIRRLYAAPDLRRELAKSARQRAATVFSIDSWTERLVDVYRSLTADTHANTIDRTLRRAS